MLIDLNGVSLAELFEMSDNLKEMLIEAEFEEEFEDAEIIKKNIIHVDTVMVGRLYSELSN